MNSAKSRGSGSVDSGEIAEYPSDRREPDLDFHVSFLSIYFHNQKIKYVK